MRRAALLLCVVLGATAFILGTPGGALAGGGCHTGATQADASAEDEVTVRIVDACFTASITKVEPGAPVTFVNLDAGLTHNVLGNGWGHYDDMTKGDAFTATFAEAGVYPFACSYHPGMTGAIVVGDGFGAGNGAVVDTAPLDLEPASRVTSPAVARPASEAPWIAAAGIAGVALGAGIAAGIGRLRRTRATG
jgi:plastocyanin